MTQLKNTIKSWLKEISKHKGEPDYIAPPEPKKPDVYGLETSFFRNLGSQANDITFIRLQEFAKCVDPAYYDLEGDKLAVKQRKAEIETVKAPLLAQKGKDLVTLSKGLKGMVLDNNKRADEIAKAQEYIDTTVKASKLAAEKLNSLPPFNSFPKELQTEEFKLICKNYSLDLKNVANIQKRSRIFTRETNEDIEELAVSSQKLSAELEKNKKKFSEEFRKSVADSAEKFTANYFDAKDKSEGFAENQDMTTYIDNKKHEMACVEAKINADFTKDSIFDSKETRQLDKLMDNLDDDIQRSNDANKVFIRHNDYDDAIRAMNKVAANLKKYQNFIGTKYKYDKTEKDLVRDTEQKAKALRKLADEATEKLEAYIERKSKQGALNEKGQRRVEVFKKALETTKKIGRVCDNRLIENDAKKASITNNELFKMDAQAAKNTKIHYDKVSDNESLSGIEKMSADVAYYCAKTLEELVSKNRELNKEEKVTAREAIACIVVFEKHLFDPKSKPTLEEYGAQVSIFADDPSFVKAVDLSAAGIRDFVAAKDIKKEVSKVYGRYLENRDKEKQAQAAIKENVDKHLEKQKERNLENNGPVKNPF